MATKSIPMNKGPRVEFVNEATPIYTQMVLDHNTRGKPIKHGTVHMALFEKPQNPKFNAWDIVNAYEALFWSGIMVKVGPHKTDLKIADEYVDLVKAIPKDTEALKIYLRKITGQ